MQTVVMKDVNPVLPDSMKIGEEGLMGEDGVVPGAELDLAARSVIDSTYIVDVPQDTTQALGDSVYVISKDKEVRLLKYNTPDSAVYDETTGRFVPKTPKYGVADVRFNVEQDNYMWYLRKNLVLPDVRLSQAAQAEQKKETKKKKGFFLTNLFKRKKKDKVDSTAITVAPKSEDEFDYVDENEQVQADEQIKEEPQKKKGLFKKKQKTEEVGAEGQQPAKEKKKKKEKKSKADNGDKPKEQDDDDDGF